LPVLICYTLIQFRLRFGLAIGFLLLAGMSYQGVYGKVLYRERSFFGIHRVTLNQGGDYYNLVNGSTVHGIERVEHSGRAEPFTYYHPSGPIGQLFTALSGKDVKKEVALVGLGAGSLAFYGEPGEHFTYYEIDPAVVRIARDSGYFTFLRDCQAKLDYVLGDARLTLHAAPDNQYGILVMDAFSSDAIPLHLLTREALELYLRKLKPNGILAFHISNNYLELAPALAALAKDAGLQCWSQFHVPREEGPVWPAHWVLMAHQQKDLGRLLNDHLWAELKAPPGASVWTDDFSNIISVLRWR
jgi:spermidine synthase